MYKVIFSLVFLVCPSLGEDTKVRAASNNINCGCQCSNYAIRDQNENFQGNCRSVDQTGATWCYVDQSEFVKSQSTCQDLQRSERFPNRFWSYEACATPSIYSAECQGFGGGNIPCSGFGCGNQPSVVKQPSIVDLFGGRAGTGGAPPS